MFRELWNCLEYLVATSPGPVVQREQMQRRIGVVLHAVRASVTPKFADVVAPTAPPQRASAFQLIEKELRELAVEPWQPDGRCESSAHDPADVRRQDENARSAFEGARPENSAQSVSCLSNREHPIHRAGIGSSQAQIAIARVVPSTLSE